MTTIMLTWHATARARRVTCCAVIRTVCCSVRHGGGQERAGADNAAADGIAAASVERCGNSDGRHLRRADQGRGAAAGGARGADAAGASA